MLTHIVLFQGWSLSSVFNLVKRWKISYQRGRSYHHSPDQNYADKYDYIKAIIERLDPDKEALLFLDEFSFYNHPGVYADWSRQTHQPLARRALGAQKRRRLLGAIEVLSGRSFYWSRSAIRIPTLVGFYQHLCAQMPGKRLYIVVDNWPVHFHPELISALEKQHSPFEYHLPKNWLNIKIRNTYKQLNLPIQLLSLPTYASWLNPIEKVWKWLNEEVLHHHTFAERFDELKNEVVPQWLEQLGHRRDELLHRTGLCKTDGIFPEITQKRLTMNPQLLD